MREFSASKRVDKNISVLSILMHIQGFLQEFLVSKKLGKIFYYLVNIDAR